MDFVIVRFLMKLFNTTNMDIISNCRQYFDVKLPSTLSLIVSEGLRKSSPHVTIFVAKFQSQFDSLYLSLS